MRADSTFVNMKDVDITDQGPDTGNNDIAVLRGAGWGRSRGWRGRETRVRDSGAEGEGGISEGRRACQPISRTYTHTCTRTTPPPTHFKKGSTQICIILRVLNFQPVSSSYFNKATNQCWFRSSTGALLWLWHSISCPPPLVTLRLHAKNDKTGREETEGKNWRRRVWWRAWWSRQKSRKEDEKGKKKERGRESTERKEQDWAERKKQGEERDWWLEFRVRSGWLGVTAECKVPAAAVDILHWGRMWSVRSVWLWICRHYTPWIKAQQREKAEDWEKGGEKEKKGFHIFFLSTQCVYQRGLFSDAGESVQLVRLALWESINLGNIRAPKAVGNIKPVRHF